MGAQTTMPCVQAEDSGPAPVSKVGQGVPGVHRFLSSSLHFEPGVKCPCEEHKGVFVFVSAYVALTSQILICGLQSENFCVLDPRKKVRSRVKR